MSLFDQTLTVIVFLRSSISVELPAGQWNLSDLYTNGYMFERSYTPSGVGDLFDTGEDVVVTKQQIKGQGRVMQLSLQSQEGKDLHIYGAALAGKSHGAF